MTERAPKLTLIYFRFSASAETLRLAAAIGKIPFTNKAINDHEWKPPPGKELDPRYRLPILEIEVKGKEKQCVSQQNAILHYLGRRGGLYPGDPLEGLQVEYMLDTVSEALRPLEVSDNGAVASLLSDRPWTREELFRIRGRIAQNEETGLPLYLSFFEKALQENHDNQQSKWLVGTDVSIADLQLYHLVCWISGGIGDGDGPSLLQGIESSLIKSYPLLLRHKYQVETLPEVTSWRAKYSPPYSIFEYRPPFEFRSIGRRSRLDNPPLPLQAANISGRLDPSSSRGKWMSTFPKLTLSYFPIAARAEPIRLTAAIGKVPFTNRAISKEDWVHLKRFRPLAQLPTLSVIQPGKDLVTAPQSTAILRYIGKLGDLYPHDDVEIVQVEFVVETIVEALKMLEMTVTGVVKSLILDVLWSKKELLQIQRRLIENQERGLPLFLNFFENLLGENRDIGWLVGSKLTVADMFLYHLVSWLQDSGSDSGVLDGELLAIGSSVLNDYPLLRQHKASIERNSAVVYFRDQHKSPYSTFDFIPQNIVPESAGGKVMDSRPAGVRRMPSGDGLPISELRSDNRPKIVRRLPSTDSIPSDDRRLNNRPPRRAKRTSSQGGLPKNVARSKSSDQVPKAPIRQAPNGTADDDSCSGNTKKTGSITKTPLRRKESFDVDSFGSGRISRGGSMPPRARPAIFDDDDDYVNFSDESEIDLNESFASLGGVPPPPPTHSPTLGGNQYMYSPKRDKRDEFWDDSSTSSFDDETSRSSVEHDLAALNMRVEVKRKEEEASRERQSAAQKEKKRRKKAESRPKKNTGHIVLPSNAPRHVAPKKKKVAPRKQAAKNSIPAKKNATPPKAVKKISKEVKANPTVMPECAPRSNYSANAKGSPVPPAQLSPALPATDKLSSTTNTNLPRRQSMPTGTGSAPRRAGSTPKKTGNNIKRFPSNDRRMSFPVNSVRGPGRVVVPSDLDEQDEQPLSTGANNVAKVPGTNRHFSDFTDSKGSHSPEAYVGNDGSDGASGKDKRLTIIYFDIPGRAESLRMAAVISNIPFTNLAISSTDYGYTYKRMAPLDQLPVFEIEEAHNRKLVIPQSSAILRYLGMLGGMYPEDPAEALIVDSICECVSDALRQIEISMRSSSRSILEFKSFTDEECAQIRVRLVEDEEHGARKFLTFFERRLECNFSRFNGWVAQNKVTIADLLLYQLVSWLDGSFGACLNGFMMDGFPADILSEFPLLQLHKERLEDIKQIKSFRALHGHPYGAFDFVPEVEVDSRPDYNMPVTDLAMLPRLTLTHMKDSRGVDALRFAAAIGKIPFIDKVIERESQEWFDVYERRVKICQFPILEIEESGTDKKFVLQPQAILRYFCKLGGLYPSNPIDALEVESVLATISEIQHLLEISLDETLQVLMSGSAWTANENWSVRRRIAKNKENGLPFYLSYFEKALSDTSKSSPWLVGEAMTMADLSLYSFMCFLSGSTSREDVEPRDGDVPLTNEGETMSHYLDGLPDTLFDDYPALIDHRRRTEHLPAVVSIHSKLQRPYSSFSFRPTDLQYTTNY